MALDDGEPRKQEDRNVTKHDDTKSGLTNGDTSDMKTLEEQLVKQQERTQGLEAKLKQLGQEWSAEKKELEKRLEDMKDDHELEVTEAHEKYEKVVEEKKHLGEQYKNLLHKVATLKERMGEKLKADADVLAEARNQTAELEEQNILLTTQLDDLRTEYRKLNEESYEAIKEAKELRNRLSLSQQNWLKERNELIEHDKHLRDEYETMKQAMVIAMEERESLADRVLELEEQLTGLKVGYERAIQERDQESQTIDGLQKALKEIQEARRQEMKELLETMQRNTNQLTTKFQTTEQRATEAETQLAKAQDDLERFQQFEKEVKEKNLLIGKLRHEAVTLNDHLTKALRMLKKGNASDNVDKQLVSNVFLQFLTIQRGDTKKYEVLQLIASVLDWNDEQRERAGLVRPGASFSAQNTTPATPSTFSRAASPLMPFQRTSSTPSLSDPYEGSRELWSSVLESPSN